MKVTVDNEKIATFISYHGYTKEQFAKLCHIKRKQVDTLLTKKKINIAISTILDIAVGMEMQSYDIFPTIESVTADEKIMIESVLNALHKNRKYIDHFPPDEPITPTKKDMN